jgi:ketosteroid isomerase-like protein
MTQMKITAVERYFNALGSLNRENFLNCFSGNAELRDPYGGRVFEGREGLSKWFVGMERTWDTFSMNAIDTYESGDRLAASWTASAMAKNGKTASFAGINVFTIDEKGLISRLEGYWDASGMMAQIS